MQSSPFFGKGESFASLVDVDLDAFRRRKKSRSVMLNVSAIAQGALKKELGIA